jgi:hypothetical protein
MSKLSKIKIQTRMRSECWLITMLIKMQTLSLDKLPSTHWQEINCMNEENRLLKQWMRTTSHNALGVLLCSFVMCDLNKWMPSGYEIKCVLHTTLWRKPTIAHMAETLVRFKGQWKSIANERWNLAWWLVGQPILSHVPTPSPQTWKETSLM